MSSVTKEKIYAGIVTFNPEIEILIENIMAVICQVDKIIIFDNGSNNINIIKDQISDSRCIFLESKINLGIGHALNEIMSFACGANVNWVLLLDQDSVIPGNMIERYSKLTYLDKVAVICPSVRDRNLCNEINEDNKIERVGIAITSGSFNNVSIWKKIGKFREDFFIDSVDSEYCIRLFFNDYYIYRDNGVVLSHELGNRIHHKLHNASNHNAMRRYYISRNGVYTAVGYNCYLRKYVKNRNEYKNICLFLDELISIKVTLRRQVQYIIIVLLYEKDKTRKVKNIIRGTLDGFKMKKEKPIKLTWRDSN